MTLLKIDGFEHKDPTRYTGGTVTFRDTGQRFSVGTVAGSAAGTKISVPASAQLFVGFAFNPVTGTGLLCTLQSDNGNNNQIRCMRNANGSLRLENGNGGIVYATSAAEVSPDNTWVYVEISGTNAPSGGIAILRVNGVEQINTTGDTQLLGTAGTLDSVMFGGATSTPSFDDLYICNALGSDNNTFLGDVRVHTLVPTGNGANSGLLGSDGNSTDNYLLVDELPPSEVDYAASGTPGVKDTYLLTDLSTSAPVLGVQVGYSALKSDAGAIQSRSVVRVSATDYPGTTDAPGTTKSAFLYMHQINPATGVAWTPAEVNALEAGMEVVA